MFVPVRMNLKTGGKMKSYLAKVGEIDRKYILFDADGVVAGRLAVRIANALRGKDKPTYTPHIDTGNFVIVINAAKIKLTGKKEERKIYTSYSGYRSGLKNLKASEVRAKNPERIIQDAVWGMLKHGRLGRELYKKLKVYPGAEHPHKAQNPEIAKL
jgi:large subunit ribosomal protein L13